MTTSQTGVSHSSRSDCTVSRDRGIGFADRRDVLRLTSIAALAGVASIASPAYSAIPFTQPGENPSHAVEQNYAYLEAAGIALILNASGHQLTQIHVAADSLPFPMPQDWVTRISDKSLGTETAQLFTELGMDLIAKSAGNRPKWT